MSRGIDFALSHEEILVRDAARGFARDRLAPRVRAHERDGLGADVAREFATLELGAARRLGALAEALALEELAAGDAAAALALCGGPGAYFDDGGGWLHVGHGARVPFALACERILWLQGDRLCAASGESRPIEALALHAGRPCEILAIDTIGAREIWRDAERAATAMADTRRLQAALLVGLARASLEYVVAYTTARVTFGRPVAHHQAVAFMLAEMAMRVDAARLLLWRACAEPAESAAAFLEAAEAGLHCGETGVQLLGGHGFLKDHPQEKRMREARAVANLWGGRGAASGEAGGGP